MIHEAAFPTYDGPRSSHVHLQRALLLLSWEGIVSSGRHQHSELSVAAIAQTFTTRPNPPKTQREGEKDKTKKNKVETPGEYEKQPFAFSATRTSTKMVQRRPAKPPRPPSRSRFQEGSMNDRVSATPPVHFIGPEDHDMADRPSVVSTIRPVSEEVDTPLVPQPSLQAQQPTQRQEPPPQQQQPQPKRGSKQFLGQVWDGVRDVLRIRKDTSAGAAEKRNSQVSQASSTARPQDPATAPDDRPSRDEVYANYQNLVASGFFASHAIQSSRQPFPGRPSTAHPCAHEPQPQPRQVASPPRWPLPQEPITPTRARPSSPICSPLSASSRGTKRAAADDEDDGNDGEIRRDSNDGDGDDVRPSHKLRKIASTTRDASIPVRRSSSRLAARRSLSSLATASQSQHREPARLTKRVLGRLPLHAPDRGPSAARRNVTEPHGGGRPRDGDGDKATAGDRVLRPRRSAAEPLRVRPNANRGIPSVPHIPPKFTYGEDRENNGPWRGLRRPNHASSYVHDS